MDKHDIDTLRQEAQLEVYRGKRTMDIGPEKIIALLDALNERPDYDEGYTDGYEAGLDDADPDCDHEDLRDVVQDALIALRTDGDPSAIRVQNAIEILEEA